MEFASKYEWVSVLKYDNEFRQLQGIYGYPWNYDCSTLLVTLVPKPPSNSHKSKFSPQVPQSQGASHNAEGKPICGGFNSRKGCTRIYCNYSHECNRKINDSGKACGKSHPAYRHQQPFGTSSQAPRQGEGGLDSGQG